MKTKFLFYLITSLIFCQNIWAENSPEHNFQGGNSVITGRILDENGLPLPGASVWIKKIQSGAVTNENGFYRITKLDAGTYLLNVSYIGFRPDSQKVVLPAGKTVTANFNMKAGIDINTVVVNGALQGQSKAINQQKNSLKVTNIISADQVGRFPDSNVGDALKRIPGINVEYDQGEARFGTIRGASPELNSVTINGDRIPSAEAETRSVQLDLVPSDMVQSIEVSKVITADMDGDAIGGAINLVTKSAPSKQRISGSVGSNYNFLSEKAAINAALTYGNRFFNKKLGVILSGSYMDNKLGSDNIEAEWENDNGTYMSDFQIRTYYVERLRQSYSASLDYNINDNNKLSLKGMYNHRNDWENRYRLRYKNIEEQEDGSWQAEIRRQTKGGTSNQKNARLENQHAMDFSLDGEHHIGSVSIDWKASFAKASEKRPHERYINYRAKKVDITPDITDPREPVITVNDDDVTDLNDNFSLKELTEEFQNTEDEDRNFKFNIEIPISNGLYASKLKTGFAYKAKKKNRENKFHDYSPVDEDSFTSDALNNTINATKSNFLAGDYTVGHFVTKNYLGSLDLTNTDEYDSEEDLEELAGNFEANEQVTAVYARFDQKLGAHFMLTAGARVEQTNLKYTGRELDIDSDGNETLSTTDTDKDYYTNLLPSLIVKYTFGKNNNLKAAISNTISRPKYYDLVPHVEISQEDNEIEIGNPSLTPTKSMNLDLMYEHYFQSIGLFSAGGYYKDIEDFIVDEELTDYTYGGTTYDKFTKPINGGDADLLGFEVSFQRQFDFLGGFFKQMGLYANYTYNHSKVENFQIEGREDDDLSLSGTPKTTYNVSLYYEGKSISARLSFNHTSDFVDDFGESTFYDSYYDKVDYLDLNASYAFSKHFRFYAEANNLLNTPLRYFQGTSDQVQQAEYYNVKINFGLKFDF